MKNLTIFFQGRLGNAIFKYFGAAIISTIYNARFCGNDPANVHGQRISDGIMLDILKGNKHNLPDKITISGFCQLEEITTYKKCILDHLNNNKDDILYTDRNEQFLINQIINPPVNFSKFYQLAIHIRLEDFVEINEFIQPSYLLSLFEKIEFNKYESKCIVCNKITTDFEKEYLKQLTDWFEKRDIQVNIESNDQITDYHIMMNSNALVCSKSTLSWCAALLSSKVQLCYFPNYKIRSDRIYQTFKHPLENTILYDVNV